jgi:hypothetical protein
MRCAPLSRAIVVALALGGALVALPFHAGAVASGCPTSDPCIAVHLQSGTQYVTATQITNEATAAAAASAPNAVQNVQYSYSASSGQPGPFVALGLSENALLTELLGPIGFSHVTFTELTRPIDGTEAILQSSHGDLAAPSDFEGGLLPVFRVNGSAIDYIRQYRNATDDATQDDEVETDPGGMLDLYVGTGPLLTVTSQNSPQAPKIGAPVTFTASSSGDSVPPKYTWQVYLSYPDQVAVFHGRRATHVFSAAGEYEVVVSAAGADGAGGFAAPLFVLVGKVHASPSKTPHPGGTGTPSPSHTPRQSGTPAPTPSTSGPGLGSPSASAGTGSASPGPSAASSGGPSAGKHSPPPPDVGGLPIVDGRLIAQTVALRTLPGSVVDRSLSVGSAAAPLSHGWRVTVGAASVVAIMLLFGWGAARELRWSRTGPGAGTWVRRH